MRHFHVITAHGESTVKVPKGKTLADVGYPEGSFKEAIEVTRAPREHEKLDRKGRKWVRDDDRAQEEDLRRRGRALGRGGLLKMIEALQERVAVLEAPK